MTVAYTVPLAGINYLVWGFQMVRTCGRVAEVFRCSRAGAAAGVAVVATLAAALSVGAAVGLASQPTPGAKYKGHTDEKTSASFRVAKSAKSIPSYTFYFDVRCNGGSNEPTAFGRNKGNAKQTKAIPVAKDGTFALRETVKQHSIGQRIRFTISGAFANGGKQASGHFTENVNGGTCKSGKVTFKVHRV